jgi:hypothetical protein
MTVTSTTAMLVGNPEMLGAKEDAVTATVPRVEIEEALRSDAPLELILEVLRADEVTTEPERREVGIAWERSDLESLLGETSGDSIAFSFDRAELERVLDDEDFEGHGLRERAMILTVAAAAASAVASSASAIPYADPGSGAAVVQTAAPSSHDELRWPTAGSASSRRLVTTRRRLPPAVSRPNRRQRRTTRRRLPPAVSRPNPRQRRTTRRPRRREGSASRR